MTMLEDRGPRKVGRPPDQLQMDFSGRTPEQLARDGDYDPQTADIPF